MKDSGSNLYNKRQWIDGLQKHGRTIFYYVHNILCLCKFRSNLIVTKTYHVMHDRKESNSTQQTDEICDISNLS